MSCEVAAHPFQAHANYGTWSIDFGFIFKKFSFTFHLMIFPKVIFHKAIFFRLYVILILRVILI